MEERALGETRRKLDMEESFQEAQTRYYDMQTRKLEAEIEKTRMRLEIEKAKTAIEMKKAETEYLRIRQQEVRRDEQDEIERFARVSSCSPYSSPQKTVHGRYLHPVERLPFIA